MPIGIRGKYYNNLNQNKNNNKDSTSRFGLQINNNKNHYTTHLYINKCRKQTKKKYTKRTLKINFAEKKKLIQIKYEK